MEDDQQFCLRWNNHQSTLIQNFDTLLESGTLVDCTLAAEGKYLKAHKVVLSACSPYFEGLLSEHYDKHPVFILKDVKFKELKAMMDYMYRGEVNISQDQLAALLKAAESLQIKGLSDSKTGGSKTTDTRQTKVSQAASQPPLDIPQTSSHLTIEKNKVPRQSSAGDLPEDSASPQISKGLSSREGSVSPTSRKRKRLRRRSLAEDNSVENHETSNSSDMPQQMGGPALGIAPVADEKSHADAADSLGRSALMTQLTKPADEMLQLPLEKPEPNDSLIEPKSEYLEDQEESVEDLTLDDDMNDLNEMDQDTNRAGPSHDPSQHPAGLSWHVTGDRSNTGGVVGSVAAPGATDEVFLAAQEAAHRDSQENFLMLPTFSIQYEYANHNIVKISTHLPELESIPNGEENEVSEPADSGSKRDETPIAHEKDVTKEIRILVEDLKNQKPSTLPLSSQSLKKLRHQVKTSVKCPICDRKFHRRNYLTRHLKVHGHETVSQVRSKNAAAVQGGKSRQRKKNKNSVENSSSQGAKKSTTCQYCKKEFKCSSNLKKHMTTACKRREYFRCVRCGNAYKYKHGLGEHLKYRCGVEPRFCCFVCGHKFYIRGSLTRHLTAVHEITDPSRNQK